MATLLALRVGIVLSLFSRAAWGAAALPEVGQVRYEPVADESSVPERFRLPAHEFPFELRPDLDVSDRFTVSHLTFPSPVTTAVEVNNTVHCEYYRPVGEGRRPAVVVLHILGGDFALSRLFCNALAQRGVAALFLKMPYYGPRREPGNPRRMISPEPEQTVEGMTQAVLDIRRAAAWLRARPEVDSERLGIFGISLGGITGALAATAEPRLRNICLLLAGGDISKVVWESPETAELRRRWLEKGRTRDELFRILAEVDPARYAQNVRGRNILLLNAQSDEVIPKACTESLWHAMGEPPIEWYSGGHYSVAVHLFSVLLKVGVFFGG